MPSFTATPGEQSLAAQIFAQTDAKDGILRGDVAVRIFAGAKLSPTALREIWNIADDENNGWLSKKGVAIALRLMGHAQNGEAVSAALIDKPGPLPTIEGTTAVVAQRTGGGLIPQRTGPSLSPMLPAGFPPLTPQDRIKFNNMFIKAGPTNGMLTGEQARDIFIKSKLPNEVLLQIWNLADTKDLGMLDAADFAVGMYFIQAVMSKKITTIPATLPPALYQQAGGSTPSVVGTHSTGTSGSFSPTQSAFPSTIQRQYTGQTALPFMHADLSGLGKPPPPPIPARPTPSQLGSSAFGIRQDAHWDVTPQEKQNSDAVFTNLDSKNQGYIEGDVAVPFMLSSKLSEQDLALIWDLADIKEDGRLNRETFALAMHLIQKKMSGGVIPSPLPISLIPPSMRGQIAANGASPFSPPGHAPPQEPQKDLFSWDDTTPPQSPTPSAAVPSVPVQHTGTILPMQPSGTGSSFPPPLPRRAPAPPIPAASPFGASPASSVPTGSPFATASPFGTSSLGKDLLGDDDEQEQTFHEQAAEIGNTQNQLNSTNKSLETTKTERVDMEQKLANQAGQLSALQTQLSTSKAAYETETQLLANFRERFNTQTADIQKVREELITAESDLSAVRVEKAEVEQTFLRDKEEARELHRKMIEVGQQVDLVKQEIEKAKKDAKQQKGLLAIAKKQLATKEAEKLKAEKELLDAKSETESVLREKKAVEAEIETLNAAAATPQLLTTAERSLSNDSTSFAASQPLPERALSSDSLTFAAAQSLPGSPDPSSPSVASIKSNNPFERLTGGGTPRPQSPLVLNVASGPVVEPVSSEAVAPSSEDDPFGLNQPAANGVDINDKSKSSSGPSTPKAPPADIVIPTFETETLPRPSSVLSPMTAESEFFATPLQSATGSPAMTPAKQNTIDQISEKFPALDEPTVVPVASSAPEEKRHLPGHFSDEESEQAHTDLGAQLKEIEVHESDSDSDSDDDVPLAEIAQAKAAESPRPTTNGSAAPPPALNPPHPAFDDIFGVTPPTALPPTTAASGDGGSFGLPALEGSHLNPEVSGVSAFDEAMGKIGSPPSSAAPPLSFESAFEDTFDFGGSSFKPNTEPTTNGHTVSTSDFDDVFSAPSPSANGTALSGPVTSPAAPVPASAAPAQQTGPGPSFDEAFATFDTTPSLTLNTTPSAPSNVEPPKAAPVPESPQQPPPHSSPKSIGGKSTASARPSSPPPRSGSPLPKGRVSSSSSKDSHEKAKDPPPTRTSKLSLRLPFGRKKNKEAPPPPPALSPPREEPGNDEDVEAVKSLISMGFARQDAVKALEQTSYDLPTALNVLLAKQGQP